MPIRIKCIIILQYIIYCNISFLQDCLKPKGLSAVVTLFAILHTVFNIQHSRDLKIRITEFLINFNRN